LQIATLPLKPSAVAHRCGFAALTAQKVPRQMAKRHKLLTGSC
jgi:hypothetical protein